MSGGDVISNEVVSTKDCVGGPCEICMHKNIIHHAADLSLTSGSDLTGFCVSGDALRYISMSACCPSLR